MSFYNNVLYDTEKKTFVFIMVLIMLYHMNNAMNAYLISTVNVRE